MQNKLRPEQRAKLAAKLREIADSGRGENWAPVARAYREHADELDPLSRPKKTKSRR